MCLSYYSCISRWSGEPPPNNPKTEEEALASIDGFYNARVPFFSKDVLRSALEQMQRPLVEGDKIVLEALDGAMVEYKMRTGAISLNFADEDPEEWVMYVKYLSTLETYRYTLGGNPTC